MKIMTKYLDKVTVEQEKVINFDQGIPGFQDEKQFVLLDIPNNEVVQILQSIKSPSIAFIVTNPHMFYPTYEFTLEEHIIEGLNIKDEKDVAVISIMTVQDPFENSTINLKAPIIINTKNKRGKQFILNTDNFKMKMPIVHPSSKEAGETPC